VNPKHQTLTLLLACIALVLPTAVTFIYFVAFAGQPSWLPQTAYGVGKTVQFLLPALWLWIAGREYLRWPRQPLRGVGIGAAFGCMVTLLMLGAYFLLLKPAGFFDAARQPILQKVQDMGVASPLPFIMLGIGYALVHSLLEEYYWRWFVFERLRAFVPLKRAAFISSAGFMAHHVIIVGVYFGYFSPTTWLLALSVGVGGLVWAWMYELTRSLAGPWISHLLIDAAIFAVGYDLVFNY